MEILFPSSSKHSSMFSQRLPIEVRNCENVPISNVVNHECPTVSESLLSDVPSESNENIIPEIRKSCTEIVDQETVRDGMKDVSDTLSEEQRSFVYSVLTNQEAPIHVLSGYVSYGKIGLCKLNYPFQ